MNGVVGPIRRTVESLKERFLKEFVKEQQKELDKKVDVMLKPKVNRIMIKFLGVGASFGRKMGAKRIGAGIGKALKSLKRIF